MMNAAERLASHALGDFLFPAPAPREGWKIVGWWERRRLFYNVAVGVAGLVSWVAITGAASLLSGRLFVAPWQPVVAFGVLANGCYLLGPCVEILLLKLWGRTVLPVGPSLYRMGLTFSVGLALFPTLLAIVLGVAAVLLNLLG
jgi:hypothetical protein